MAGCPAFDPAAPYTASVLAWVDCQVGGISESGFHALGPGSGFGTALTGLLTIFVALIGYRLLLGGRFDARDGAMAALRLGIVLTFATQWIAYRAVVYDAATAGPGQLASALLTPADGTAFGVGDIANRVDGVSAAIADLLNPPRGVIATPNPAASPTAAPGQPVPISQQQPTPHDLPIDARQPVASAAGLLVTSTLAGLVSTRLVTGLLLALGPGFIAMLLFDQTLGLFVGWVRVLVGAAIGGAVAPVVVAMELSILVPQVLALRDLVDAGAPVGVLPIEILATASLFALAMLAALVAVAAVGLGFRFDWGRWHDAAQSSGARIGALAANPVPLLGYAGDADTTADRSRPQRIADAMVAMDRRDRAVAAPTIAVIDRPTATTQRLDVESAAPTALPLGQTGRRQSPRASGAGARRDATR